MKKVGMGLVKMTVVILIVACANSTLADSVFDHFDDGVLDPAWQVNYDNVWAWGYFETGTLFTVSFIIEQSSALPWSQVLLSQEFLAPADFTVEGSIAWDSRGNNSAMQDIFIWLRSGGERIVSAGYRDSSSAFRGAKIAVVDWTIYDSGPNTLPLSGSAKIRIERIADEVSIFWDDVLILNVVENRAIDEVVVMFRKYSDSSGFSLAIDYIRANSEKIQLTDLRIVGPNEMAEESTVQYTAIAVYDDSTQDVTNEVVWTVMPDNYADINDSGLLSTNELVMPTEDVTIYAKYEEGNDVFGAEKDVQIFALCQHGSALEFDGQNDYFGCGYHFSEITSSPSKTIMAWAKPHTEDFSGQEASEGRLVTLYRDLGYSGFVIMAKGTPTTWQGLYAIAGNWYDYIDSGVSLVPDQWIHVALVQDGAQAFLYINGELAGEADNADLPVMNRYANATVGCFHAGPSGTWSFFDGVIDESAIFDRALSQQEISGIVRKGLSYGEPGLSAHWSFDEGQGQIAYDSSGNENDGYLGDDPFNPDSADPCWVEVGAPLHCTVRQMIVRNISGALDDKAAAAELIDSALEKEEVSEMLLMDEMDEQGSSWRSDWNVGKSIVEIKKAMLFEQQCKQKLQAGIEALERALDWLLDDTVTDGIQADTSPKNNK